MLLVALFSPFGKNIDPVDLLFPGSSIYDWVPSFVTTCFNIFFGFKMFLGFKIFLGFNIFFGFKMFLGFNIFFGFNRQSVFFVLSFSSTMAFSFPHLMCPGVLDSYVGMPITE